MNDITELLLSTRPDYDVNARERKNIDDELYGDDEVNSERELNIVNADQNKRTITFYRNGIFLSQIVVDLREINRTPEEHAKLIASGDDVYWTISNGENQ